MMGVTARVLIGDVRERLAVVEAGSVQTCVTSPPYWGLRDYGNDGQIGLEGSPEEFVEALCLVFDEVWRVLADDGTLWLNLGDSYAAQRGRSYEPAAIGLRHKDLVGIPWRVAFALQSRGWYLRSEIIWAKPNPMPESVTDRPTKSHEHIFLLSKSANYFYDYEAIKEPVVTESGGKGIRFGGSKYGDSTDSKHATKSGNVFGGAETRNKRDVWTVPTKGYAGAHFAVYPTALIEPCVLAGTSGHGHCVACGKGWQRVTERAKPPAVEDSSLDRFGNGKAGVHRKVGQAYQNWLNENPAKTVGWQKTCECETDEVRPALILDPFSGSGTTGVVALRNGRNYLGCELNLEYAELSRKRISDDCGMFGEVILDGE